MACANLNAYTADMLEYLRGALAHTWADGYGHASKCMTVVAVCIQQSWEHVEWNTCEWTAMVFTAAVRLRECKNQQQNLDRRLQQRNLPRLSIVADTLTMCALIFSLS